MTTENNKNNPARLHGLTSAEVTANRLKYGSNILTPPKRDPWWKLLLQKFSDPIIRILLIAAVVALGVGVMEGKYEEGIGIIIAIFLATTLSFLNEFKANKEFDILNQVSDEVPVKLIRDGHYTTVPKKEIVVGDIVLMELGEEIPADGEVIEAVSLHINESRLTGESLPVRKMPKDEWMKHPTHETAYPPDVLCRGTLVSDGHGLMRVTSVGDASEIGKTARSASEETQKETPLNIQLARLSKWIGVIGFAVAAIIYTSLFTRDIINKELILNPSQWYFIIFLKIGALITLSRVWIPVVYDGFQLAGKKIKLPAWLEKESLSAWMTSVGLGLATFALGIGAGIALKIIPASPSTWLSEAVLHNLIGYFMIAVTIIVVAVPEGLPMSVTLSLAYSMRKMTKANTLVRRMHACETIGAATVICSDKTGTLTMNEMQVHQVHFPAIQTLPFNAEAQSPAETRIIESIAVNTTANLDRTSPNNPIPIGNPTEGALLLWLEKQGIDYVYPRDGFHVLYQWTFSTDRKYMATIGKSPGSDRSYLYVKGAPEILLNRCTNLLDRDGIKTLDAEYKLNMKEELKGYQARGMRTLAFAYHDGPKKHEGVEIEELTHDMTWVGFVAISDPVRPEVPVAIKTCRDAGIQVKVVTGDNPETAKEIARQINLWQEGDGTSQYLTGIEFANLSDEEASDAAGRLKILARARPLDKLRLVKLLQKRGHVVAVTGDGTNDAPALNYADVGMSMGKTGTSIAKEASDMIILDDSFGSIVNGVMWGRSLYENIQRFILFQLTINVVALGIALLGPFIGVKLPLTVTQMLWINLVMDTFAALALATEPPHRSVMRRNPRNPQAFIVTPSIARNIFSVGAVFLVFLIGFLFFIQRDGNVDVHELSIFFTIFVMLQFWNLFNARSLAASRSAFHHIWQNKAFLVIVGAILVGQILIIQFGREFLRTEPLSLKEWILIISGTSVVLWMGEIYRWILRKKQRHI